MSVCLHSERADGPIVQQRARIKRAREHKLLDAFFVYVCAVPSRFVALNNNNAPSASRRKIGKKIVDLMVPGVGGFCFFCFYASR